MVLLKGSKETTEVIYGEDQALSRYKDWLSKSKLWLDTCGDSNAPSVDVGVKEYNDALLDCTKRGFRLRYITDITKDNLKYSKELSRIVELRHLDGIKGNFAVTENQYLGVGKIQEAKPVPLFIISDVKEIVEQQQFIFETLWNHAIPAEYRIRELEQGVKPEKTQIFYGTELALPAITDFFNKTIAELNICVDKTYPAADINVEEYRNSLTSLKENKDVRIKYITEITRENISYCKELMRLFAEVRHLDNVKTNFAVNESEYMAAATSSVNGQPIPQVISSNIPDMVQQQKFLFDALWQKAIPAEKKIEEIEENKPAERTEVIYGQDNILKTLNAFLDEIDSEVRILAPRPIMIEHLENIQLFQRLLSHKEKKNTLIKLVASFGETNRSIINRISPYVQYKSVEPLPMSSILFVRDGKQVLLINFSVSSKDEPQLNMLLQSTDQQVVETMLSTFDAWWNQVENNDRMIEEKAHAELLLDLITHDLGNHNQIAIPNLELAQTILKNKGENISLTSRESEELRQYLTGAERAFERSLSLVENIRKLERMYSEKQVDLAARDLIAAIGSASSTIKNSRNDKEILISLTFEGKDRPLVLADNLLEEIFVNLFANAANASNEQQVEIDVDIHENTIGSVMYWMIHVSDRGKGIPDNLKSELFARFYSKAKGSGLGLSIVRGLVERYRGQIWAGDRVYNDHTKGAKFGIILRAA